MIFERSWMPTCQVRPWQLTSVAPCGPDGETSPMCVILRVERGMQLCGGAKPGEGRAGGAEGQRPR
jgi:hypothetical protein